MLENKSPLTSFKLPQQSKNAKNSESKCFIEAINEHLDIYNVSSLIRDDSEVNYLIIVIFYIGWK